MTLHSRHPSEQCRFCRIGADAEELADHDQVVARAGDFFAIPSIGSLIPGWLLAIPRVHVLNLSGVYADPRFSEFRQQLVAQLEAVYQAPVSMFEHGAACEGSSVGCGTDHAHLHLVPYDGPLLQAVFEARPRNQWSELRASRVGGFVRRAEYLFCSSKPGEFDPPGLLSIVNQPVSQFFRSALASALGMPERFDYRQHPNLSAAAATAQRLQEATSAAVLSP